MRQIDADAYASEMKKRQDACMDAMADAHSDRMYTENEHWAGVLAAFAEAKITLDKMPTVGGWVSVKDRLPENEKIVIGYTPCDGYMFIGFYRTYKSATYEWSDWCIITSMRSTKKITKKVTHWMPLPEAPKEEA